MGSNRCHFRRLSIIYLVMSVPRSYCISTGKGWRSVLLGNLNRFNLNWLWSKWLIPIEQHLRGHKLIMYHVLPPSNRESSSSCITITVSFFFFQSLKYVQANVRSLARFGQLFAAQQFVFCWLLFQSPDGSRTQSPQKQLTRFFCALVCSFANLRSGELPNLMVYSVQPLSCRFPATNDFIKNIV